MNPLQELGIFFPKENVKFYAMNSKPMNVHISVLCRNAVLAVCFAVLASPGLGATIILSDGAFFNSDWSTTTIASNGILSLTAQQADPGGNPGSFWRQEISWGQMTAGSSHVLTVASFGLLQFAPSTFGAIQSLQFDFDLVSAPRVGSISTAGNYRIYLEQNNNLYLLVPGGEASASNLDWTAFTRSSTSSSDWNPVQGFGTGSPDFSANGAPITFGFRVNISLSCPANVSFCNPGSLVSGMDNYTVTINTVENTGEPSEIPEPTTAVLCALGLAVGAFRLRRQS